MPVEPSRWVEITRANPDHSTWYIQRFRDMAANGDDLDGEARFVDAMVARGSRILDAGCGPGRVGGALHALGHDVVGVDVDPVLIEAADTDHPGSRWFVGDLAELDLIPGLELTEAFDVIACVGNVFTFLAATTRRPVLAQFAKRLQPDGRAVIAFGSGRDYEFDDFFEDARSEGFAPSLLLESFDLRPFTSESTFLVAVMGHVSAQAD